MELMKVKVRFASYLRSEVGIKELTLHLPLGSTLNDLIKELYGYYDPKMTPVFVVWAHKPPKSVFNIYRAFAKKQFQNTVRLFREIKFNNAYIAKYSPRPGTAAFQMEDNVPLIEKGRFSDD